MTSFRLFVTAGAFAALALGGCSDRGTSARPIPADIQQIFDKPRYASATWGLRVVDLDSGEVIYDLEPNHQFLIGSVRKLFSVGELLNQVGPDYQSQTSVYARGQIANGVLAGDLILVASGDLTMGGRTNPDGAIAITDFDHNEADSLGQAILTAPDPLAGYDAIARQVASAGITSISGDVVIDDRLFVPFFFRDQFYVRPIFVNDDVVDVSLDPTSPGAPASTVSRPLSAAFTVVPQAVTGPAGSQETIAIDPELPQCIGAPGCSGTVSGSLPVGFSPPLNGQLPLVRTFRIVEPASYARTVLIEALQRAGVTVSAPAVAANPVDKLPPKDSYVAADRVANLTSLSYGEHARFILKVSYNIGADTSLVLFGLTQGADGMDASLAVERGVLRARYGIPDDEFFFVDGSGGGLSTATNDAVTRILIEMAKTPVADAYASALPVIGIDGSLATVTDFESDPTLAGALGHMQAKPGSFVEDTPLGPSLRAQAFAGYITAKSGRRLVYALPVNDVGIIRQIDDVLEVFQDQGTISAILWRDN
jgi:D-alanyl-D-alanine carboxypeptidase/D-alanyl-D-alanine-endopeptidase (penicillin-binding protein 4)